MSGARQVLVTRAEPGAGVTALRLLDRAYAPVVAPLLRVVTIPDAALNLDGVQAVLFSSAAGARAYAERGGRTDIRALCVGEATALAARAAGFADVGSAEGDAMALALMARTALTPAGGAVLWASGEDTARDISDSLRQAGFATRRAILYRAEIAPRLPAAAEAALRGRALAAVLFHSARAAQAFARLAEKAGLAAGAKGLAAVCMSGRVADAARALDWDSVAVADEPDEGALLAALDSALAGASRAGRA